MADITLSINNPIKVFTAFSAMANKPLLIQPINHEGPAFTVNIPSQEAGESDVNYGKRVIAYWGRVIVRMYNLGLDSQRRITELNNVSPATENTPEDIIE